MMWPDIKKILEYVDLSHKVIALGIAIVGGIVAFVNPSKTLAIYVVFGILLGSIAGFFRTASKWHGKGKSECQRQIPSNIFAAAIAILLFAIVLAILQPEFASRFDVTRVIREFLLGAIVLTNVLLAFVVAFAMHCVVSAIVLCSPRLWSA